MIFVDTSALYAVLDRDDQAHESARDAWIGWLSDERDISLLTSNYVLVESFALLQSRLGIEAVRAFHDDLLPVLQLQWTTPEDHEIATQALLLAGRRQLSLVDCTSFQLMRRLGVSQAFAFDRHFEEQGFELLPG